MKCIVRDTPEGEGGGVAISRGATWSWIYLRCLCSKPWQRSSISMSAWTKTSPIVFLAMPLSAVPNRTACTLHPPVIYRGSAPFHTASVSPFLYCSLSPFPYTVWNIKKFVEIIESRRRSTFDTICRHISSLEILSPSVDTFLRKSIDSTTAQLAITSHLLGNIIFAHIMTLLLPLNLQRLATRGQNVEREEIFSSINNETYGYSTSTKPNTALS